MSNKSSCANCIWEDICDGAGKCGHYSPIDESDIYIEELVENNRKEFMTDWKEYVKEYAD